MLAGPAAGLPRHVRALRRLFATSAARRAAVRSRPALGSLPSAIGFSLWLVVLRCRLAVREARRKWSGGGDDGVAEVLSHSVSGRIGAACAASAQLGRSEPRGLQPLGRCRRAWRRRDLRSRAEGSDRLGMGRRALRRKSRSSSSSMIVPAAVASQKPLPDGLAAMPMTGEPSAREQPCRARPPRRRRPRPSWAASQ